MQKVLAFRNFRKKMKLNILLFVIIFLGGFCYAGFESATQDLLKTTELCYEENRIADYWFYYDQSLTLPYQEIQDLVISSKVEGINIRKQFVLPAELPNHFYLLLTDIGEKSANDYQIVSGREHQSNSEILINEEYAQENHSQLGSTLLVGNQEMTIVGFTQEREFIFISSSLKDRVPRKSTVAIIRTLSEFKYPFEYVVGVRSSLSKMQVMVLLESITKTDQVKGYDRSQYAPVNGFISQLTLLKEIVSIIPFLFVLTTIFLLLINYHRKVSDDHKEIGILKSLGFSNSSIFLSYLIPALLLALFGSILGSVLGQLIIPNLLVNALSTLYLMPKLIQFEFFSTVFTYSLLLFLITFLSLLFVLSIALKKSCTTLMSERVELRDGVALFNRVSFLTYHVKLALRNMLTYKRKLVFMMISTFLTFFILLSSTIVLNNINSVVEHQEPDRYDFTFLLNQRMNSIEIEKRLKDDRYQILYHIPSSITYFEKDIVRDHYLSIYDDGYIKSSVFDSNYQAIEIKDNGVYLPYQFQKEYAYQVGDKIEFLIDEKVVSAKINGFHFSLGMSTFVMRSSYYYDLLQEKKENTLFSSAYIKLNNSKDYEEILKKLEANQSLTWVHPYEKGSESDKILKIVYLVQNLFIILSAFLMILLIYNIGRISLYQRIQDLKILKALGYQHRSICRLNNLENNIIAIFGVLIGIIPSILFGTFITNRVVTITGILVDTKIQGIQIILLALFTLFLMGISNYFLNLKIKNMNIIER